MTISIKDLQYVYMKGTPFENKALNDVNMRIKTGEFVGIIGHTGSGKSTLIQHFNGLLKPTGGQVIVDGIDTISGSLKELRRKVGLVFQYPEHQLFEETVYKDIAFGLIQMGKDETEIETKVRDVMEIVGLPEDTADMSPFELSGGQKRRAAIAGVLIMEPSVLVLDEPAAGLDPKGRNEIFGFLKELHSKTSLTVVIVSHNMEEVARIVDRVIMMKDGTIIADGKMGEIFKDVDYLERMGLKAPQITYLMKRLKERYPKLNDDIYTVTDAKNEITAYFKGQRK